MKVDFVSFVLLISEGHQPPVSVFANSLYDMCHEYLFLELILLGREGHHWP